jgi:Transposase DDE domain
MECGTHATIKAAMGSYATGETTLAGRLLGEVEPGGLAGVLLLADRLFVGAELWRTAAATGAELLWRAKTGKTAPKPPVDQVLADGSWLSRLYAASDRRKRAPVVVRVIEYAVCDPGRPQAKGVTYRLLTTILDPAQAPAAELAALYHERWEVEGALDELKTHQRGAQVVLRSKHPEGVKQEVWAHLLVHYAIRKLIHQAAGDEGLDPDRLSFVGTLRIVRRHLASHAAFPPDQVARSVRWAIAEILTERVPERRLRAYPRAVKRKMSGYKLKRAHHRTWSQPTMPVADAVVVLSKAG